jgi:hypothetical protein
MFWHSAWPVLVTLNAASHTTRNVASCTNAGLCCYPNKFTSPRDQGASRLTHYAAVRLPHDDTSMVPQTSPRTPGTLKVANLCGTQLTQLPGTRALYSACGHAEC